MARIQDSTSSLVLINRLIGIGKCQRVAWIDSIEISWNHDRNEYKSMEMPRIAIDL